MQSPSQFCQPLFLGSPVCSRTNQATNPTRYNLSPSYEYQENPWLAHYKREKRISFKTIAWMVLTVVGIYNKLMKQRKKVTILYGTETGKSKKFSKQALNLFASLYRCTLLPLDHENLYETMRSTHFITIITMIIVNNNIIFMNIMIMIEIRSSDLNIFISSTFGAGEAPTMAEDFRQDLLRWTHNCHHHH